MPCPRRISTLIVDQFSLLWMVQQMDDAGLEIKWAQNAFEDNPTLSCYLACRGRGAEPAHSNSEDHGQVREELQKDVEGVLHDSLRGFSLWWMLECIPSWKYFLDDQNHQQKKLRLVLQRGS